MAKKKKSRKMPAWRKWSRVIIGIIGKSIGTAVAVSPTFKGIRRMATGDFEGGVNDIVFDTTGMNPAAGTFQPNVTKLIGTGVTVAVGIGLIKLFGYIARKW